MGIAIPKISWKKLSRLKTLSLRLSYSSSSGETPSVFIFSNREEIFENEIDLKKADKCSSRKFTALVRKNSLIGKSSILYFS